MLCPTVHSVLEVGRREDAPKIKYLGFSSLACQHMSREDFRETRGIADIFSVQLTENV